MKAVLISIQPPHTDNIFDLLKGIEWRTKPLPTGKYYCYETKNGGGCGKVIGEFTIWQIKGYKNASHIPVNYIDFGCVPREFLMTYSKGKRIYANFIVNPIRYDKPKELREFSKYGFDRFVPWKRPPQSWAYCEELK
jgi:predicted transcriptional regulator